MNEEKGLLQEYPTPRACFLVFILCLILVVIIGSIVQLYAFLPGMYVTEWLLIFAPPVVLLWMKKVNIKESLKLQQFNSKHILLGIVCGAGMYFIMVGLYLVMVDILGPYPGDEFFEQVFPKTWLEFVPWIMAMGFSAGVCEEVLFRGFIQNGLHNHWGPLKAVIVTAILFGVFHLDPWRSPSATLLGLLAGYLLVRTGSLYTAITLHMTSNTLGQVLSFTDTLPEDNAQWLLLIGLSLVLIFVVVVIMERMKK